MMPVSPSIKSVVPLLNCRPLLLEGIGHLILLTEFESRQEEMESQRGAGGKGSLLGEVGTRGCH